MDDENTEQTKILKELLKWTRVYVKNRIKETIENEFSEEKKIIVYYLSDGRSSDDIERLLNKMVTDMTVRNWWKKWALLGFMELHPKYKKRYVRVFNLEDFGIDIPDLTGGSKGTISKPKRKRHDNNV
jgi:hypothetical protein